MSQPEVESDDQACWTRETPWRQGAFLSHELAVELGLWGDEATDQIAIVVSHDCDLAQLPEVEPYAEIIIGRVIDAVQGNYAHGKNTRMLHIACTGGEVGSCVSLKATDKQQIPKQSSFRGSQPCAKTQMSTAERGVLQRWLASRYRRSAFPDEFDRRLADTEVRDRVAKALKSTGKHISAIFFDVDDGNEIAHNGEADPYELRITLMYDTTSDPQEAEKAANEAARRIEAIFDDRCTVLDSGIKQWRWIELVSVDVIADQAMTVAAAQVLSRWNLDYLSLRSEPEGPIGDP